MNKEQDDAFRAGILKITKDFALSVGKFADAMLTTSFAAKDIAFLESGPACKQKMFVSILFTGTVYGEYILAIDEATVARLLGRPVPQSDPEKAELRSESSDTFRELLNLVVGECVVGLGKAYDKLTVTAPRVYFGDVAYPRIKTGKATLQSEKGEIECYFLLDKMRLDIAASYKDALSSLTVAHEELQMAMRKLQTQQALLVQSEKMAALGTLAAGVAHEINSPLAAVSLVGEALRDIVVHEPLDKQSFISNLDVIDRTIARISKITNSMRAYAHGIKRGELTATSSEALIQDAFLFCEQYAKDRNVTIIHEKSEPDLAISCRAPEISQALTSLILNSCDAVENLPEKWVKVSVKDLDKEVEFSVTDAGKGIPEAIREKIFDPFFTTKDVGKGVGLGLGVVKGVIESHHGSVAVDGDSANTRFVFCLPKLAP